MSECLSQKPAPRSTRPRLLPKRSVPAAMVCFLGKLGNHFILELSPAHRSVIGSHSSAEVHK